MLHLQRMANEKYTKHQLNTNIQRFIAENGREPTAYDFDTTSYLPTARQIQRRYGGLKALRAEFGLSTLDHTTGAIRSKTAAQAVNNSQKDEATHHNRLVEKYSDPDNNVWVSRQYAYQQYIPGANYYANILCDTCIEDRPNNHRILIDFFSAKDEQSVGGSIRIKAQKLAKYPPAFFYPYPTYEVLFVCLNPDLNSNKFPTPAADFITVMDINQFNQRFFPTK